MQQSEILSLAERLIPAYHAEDFDFVLKQITEGETPSAKLLVKMELNRLMAPCHKRIDLRGRVSSHCHEYQFDGLTHWFDDRAFDMYHKLTRKFGGYTEGVWEALVNKQTISTIGNEQKLKHEGELTDPNSPYAAEAINLGYDLKRKENRLRLESQVSIELENGELVYGLSVDLSNSGAKFKVPGTFDYDLGQIIKVRFDELAKGSNVKDIELPIEYRVLGVDGIHGVSPVKYLRTLRLTRTNAVEQVVERTLNTESKKIRHDNQDRITRARTRGYEHTYLKHACNLPLFFSGNELKVSLLTDNNKDIWNYWHDERHQQALGSLFSPERMELLIKTGIKGCSNVLYTFTHDHNGMKLFYSMMMPEASREERQLFWHVGAKRASWKAFRLSVFELSETDVVAISKHYSALVDKPEELTHFGILQEISDQTSASDYLFTEKPRIAASGLNRFRHPRKIIGQPRGLYFDAETRRREPRYEFRTPVAITNQNGESIEGITLDLSKRGASIQLISPTPISTGMMVTVAFKELQLYNKNLPLNQVPYTVVRMSEDKKTAFLAISESGKTIKIIAFFNGMIENNRDKLLIKNEVLPSPELLESLHNVLLGKMVSTPVYIDKRGTSVKSRVVGVNFPLPGYLQFFERISHQQNLALEPIFKGRSNSMIAEPMKRRPGSKIVYHELYIGVLKLGDRIQSVHTRLREDFDSTQKRIRFIKDALTMGELYILRVSSGPVFDALTTLMKKDINELLTLSLSHARNLENEMTAICGYCEIIDITEEVLIRLELNY
ncbi:PilZ domain-containing protein [Vibrio methylphosphonaticus]|uniref:PilZ domain-containing protein n=1 Tax=Vibrio methylphosphonaticus TaxID=2946866 RepID=UPI00202A989A|nr:PilZ domain-containing protein [Vibrio methylphosphonaticus]MCL9773311.1 PilZ domain-containing protein [Vibrio methylphosphonaticus]